LNRRDHGLVQRAGSGACWLLCRVDAGRYGHSVAGRHQRGAVESVAALPEESPVLCASALRPAAAATIIRRRRRHGAHEGIRWRTGVDTGERTDATDRTERCGRMPKSSGWTPPPPTFCRHRCPHARIRPRSLRVQPCPASLEPSLGKAQPRPLARRMPRRLHWSAASTRWRVRG